MASQIIGKLVVCSTACSWRQQSKYQSSPSLSFCEVPGGFPSQRASDVGSVSTSCRHHVHRTKNSRADERYDEWYDILHQYNSVYIYIYVWYIFQVVQDHSRLPPLQARPPARLEKLEKRKKKKKHLTEEQIKEKLEKASARRKVSVSGGIPAHTWSPSLLRLTQIRAWIRNYYNGFMWDVNTHP